MNFSFYSQKTLDQPMFSINVHFITVYNHFYTFKKRFLMVRNGFCFRHFVGVSLKNFSD